MKQLAKPTFKEFLKINELVVSTTPMRVHYGSKNKLEKWVWQKKRSIIKNLLNRFTHHSILDVGCGDGGLFELVGKNCCYVGIDISKTQLASFKHWLNEHQISRRPKLFQADITKKIPFKDQQFDGALVCDVLEHVLDPIKAINEIKRVVKKDGFIIFSIPNEKLLQIGRLLKGKHFSHSPDHLYSITVNDIQKYFPKVIKRFGIPLSLPSDLNLINIVLVKR